MDILNVLISQKTPIKGRLFGAYNNNVRLRQLSSQHNAHPTPTHPHRPTPQTFAHTPHSLPPHPTPTPTSTTTSHHPTPTPSIRISVSIIIITNTPTLCETMSQWQWALWLLTTLQWYVLGHLQAGWWPRSSPVNNTGPIQVGGMSMFFWNHVICTHSKSVYPQEFGKIVTS